MQWREQRVLVTGGAGFLGSFVVEQLREQSCQIVIAYGKSCSLKVASIPVQVYVTI